jgi:hypothetical protein
MRSDEPLTEVGKRGDFLRLPESVQVLLSDLPTRREGWTMLVTNSDRLAPIYPENLDLQVQASP